ncbi:MAG: hypothetical protein WC244_03095 [Patescibacteria group bacterium]|jgi:6-phosphogluconolactonase (cycloisomerase 2 family)
MSPDKWEQLKGQIQDQFQNVSITQEELEDVERGEKEIILFDGPLGQMRLEYITKPVILDKQTHGSRRIGSHTEVEYVYSDTEFSHSLKVYKWDDGQDNWLEIDTKSSFQI